MKLLQNTISLKNTNVDIAAKDYDGNLTEVQAKFYKGKVSKAGLDSFVAETGKDVYSSEILVSSTDQCNSNVQSMLENTTKLFTTIGLIQLSNTHFDWKKFSFAKENQNLSNQKSKNILIHMIAINRLWHLVQGRLYQLEDSRVLMRKQNKRNFNVLYPVPRIQLLSQILFSWNNDISDNTHMTSFSVVSDTKANNKRIKMIMI